MEMSVGFADKDKSESEYKSLGYQVDYSSVGKVYYPKKGVVISGPICIRYEENPWLSAFELDGITAKQPHRGIDNTKNMKMILQYVQIFNKITRKETMDLCKFSPSQATKLLAKITKGGYLEKKGKGCKTYYILTVKGKKYK